MSFWDTFEPQGTGPMYLGICRALEEAIEAGHLGPGRRLPSHRMLARKLGVSVGTVTRAYEAALDRGLITGEVGRGTHVRHRTHVQPLRVVDAHRFPAQVEDLYQNFPVPVPDVENRAWSLAMEHLKRDTDLPTLTRASWSQVPRYHQHAGAAWISRTGLDPDPRRILDCPGVPAVLCAVIAATTRPGDRIVAAALSHPAVQMLAQQFQLKPVPIPLDEEGLDVEALDAIASAETPRLLYCAPTQHNPTTTTMSDERRRAVARIARERDMLILEDESAAFLLDSPPLPISAHAPERSFFIGDVWLALCLGLRTVYLLVPEDWKVVLGRSIAANSGVSAALNAAITAYWIETGIAQELIDARRAEIQARNRLAAEILSGLNVRGDESSHHLWLELPEPWKTVPFLDAAAQNRVALTIADWFAFGRGPVPRATRICLGTPQTREALSQALIRLRAVLE